ncbi:MAG: hypothetical protein MJE77_40880, partial [Proteobacteria bacterium]|nr:hypothetical protein [Pseudomonadota bacterium]
MSLARPVYKGVSLMITKRVRGREFRLRPSKRINQIVQYVVAVVAQRNGIQLNGLVVLSNHWHVCLADPEGRICDFTRDCHAFIARAVNAVHGDFESMWSNEQTSQVTCVEPIDLVGKIAYAMANPVESLLVAHGKNWPGVRRAWPAKPRIVNRPKQFFRDETDGGTWPETAILEFSRPPGYESKSDEELATLIQDAIDQREEKFRQQARREGKRFLGRRAVLEQSRYARPKTEESRFKLSPRVACKNKWLRIERLGRNRVWGTSYAQALIGWRSGDREVVFPHGTYKMRVL